MWILIRFVKKFKQYKKPGKSQIVFVLLSFFFLNKSLIYKQLHHSPPFLSSLQAPIASLLSSFLPTFKIKDKPGKIARLTAVNSYMRSHCRSSTIQSTGSGILASFVTPKVYNNMIIIAYTHHLDYSNH